MNAVRQSLRRFDRATEARICSVAVSDCIVRPVSFGTAVLQGE